jgi:hypothetical protein
MRLASGLLLASSLFAAVDGTVVNGTTGKPQPGATVTLFKLDQTGPNALETSKAGPGGAFRFATMCKAPTCSRPSTKTWCSTGRRPRPAHHRHLHLRL